MNFEIAPESTEILATWDEARMYCFSMGDGWRLPAWDELFSILYNRPENFLSTYYWSSRENSTNSSFAYQIGLGGISYQELKERPAFVRAVRSIP